MGSYIDEILEFIQKKAKDFESEVEQAPKKKEFESAYQISRRQFENQKYAEASKSSADLLQKLLKRIIDDHYRILSDSTEFMDGINGIRRTYGESGRESNYLNKCALIDLCTLFDKVRIFTLLSETSEIFSKHNILLQSFNWRCLAQICDEYSTPNEPAADVILSIQQVLCGIAALISVVENVKIDEYYQLANFEHMTDEINKIRESQSKLSEVESKLSYLKTVQSEVDVRKFEWIKFRGMLLNTSDGSRNISFKVETMLNILTTICKGIENSCMFNEEKKERVAQISNQIICDAGYEAGSKFGWTMHEIFQRGRKKLVIQDKIKKWCEFDSDVGFGMILLKDKEGEPNPKWKEIKDGDIRYISYEIEIDLADNFLVYKKEAAEINLCSFMCGYIQGVLEKITGQPLIVTHEPTQCEQFIADLDRCTFKAVTNPKKLVESLKNAKRRYSGQYRPETELEPEAELY